MNGSEEQDPLTVVYSFYCFLYILIHANYDYDTLGAIYVCPPLHFFLHTSKENKETHVSIPTHSHDSERSRLVFDLL
jgi:hypothetical protein